MTDIATEPARRRPAPLEVDVRRVETLPGGFVRVIFGGDALSGFTWPGPASHLKFFPSGTDTPLPESGQVERPRPVSRTYTPRSFDTETGELAVDFLLHGEGVSSTWAATAKIADPVRVSIPRASYTTPSAATWQLLAGDDSAVPAIATIIDAGIVVPTLVMVETLSGDNDRPPLPRDPLVGIEWIAMDQESPGTELSTAIRAWKAPDGPGSAWVACEATAVRVIRHVLLEEHAIAPEHLMTRGYWRQGATNHPDHDFGADPLDR